jgi:MreB/Mrl family cell shape determining protein
MKEVIKLGLALLVICAIAGLALGLTYNITLPRIKAQEEAARQRLYRNLLPGADIFKEITIGAHKYQMGLLHGQRIGVVSTVTGKGYGGDRMEEALIKHVKKEYNVVIGEPTAEEIKMRVGSVYSVGESRRMEIRGRDGVTGLPCTIPVSEEDVREALQETVLNIAKQVKAVLERTPPELAADIIETGLMLTGGGALLRGLNLILQEATHIRVTVADDPLSCVAIGTGRALDEIDILSRSMATIRKSAVK